MMWSTHSRRIDPISRSAKPFCQGEAGAVGCPALLRAALAAVRRLITPRCRTRPCLLQKKKAAEKKRPKGRPKCYSIPKRKIKSAEMHKGEDHADATQHSACLH